MYDFAFWCLNFNYVSLFAVPDPIEKPTPLRSGTKQEKKMKIRYHIAAFFV